MTGTKKNFLIAILVTIGLVVLDQLTKIWAANALAGGPIRIWPGVFELYYHENSGAAFGMMQNMHGLFYIITAVITVAILWVFWRIPVGRRYHILRICLIGVLSGGIGNFIDRITHHYVIDFLYFSLIDFPIFNVADIYVTVSTFGLFFALLLYYKDADFDFINGKKESDIDK